MQRMLSHTFNEPIRDRYMLCGACAGQYVPDLKITDHGTGQKGDEKTAEM